jgi:hypothetical protein
MVAVHSWVLLRLVQGAHASQQVGPVARSRHRRPTFQAVRRAAASPGEPWPRRILGYLSGILFVGVAVAWNVGIISWLIQAADEKEGWWMLVVIPWALLGWLLLVMLFACLGALFSSLLTGLRRFVS